MSYSELLLLKNWKKSLYRKGGANTISTDEVMFQEYILTGWMLQFSSLWQTEK